MPCSQLAESCLAKLCLASVILTLRAAVHKLQDLATPAHIVHQAHTMCSKLIHINNVLLPKHMLSNSTRCLDDDTCSQQTCIRNTADRQGSAACTNSACVKPHLKKLDDKRWVHLRAAQQYLCCEDLLLHWQRGDLVSSTILAYSASYGICVSEGAQI